MESTPQTEQVQQPQGSSSRTTSIAKSVLTGLIVVFVFAVGYLSYAFISRGTNPPPVSAPPEKPQKIIQLDVLNGTRTRGVAARCMNYLRTNGFDVVEMKNYKVSNIPHTLVVDRVGDRVAARQIASALGVSEKNVIQQLNPDYFVDVSVIIGADYSSLKPFH
jgi:LytR cell envelope-related transcriptional attenuator